MVNFAKEDPQFRLDILATRILRRAVELHAPSLLPMHEKLAPQLEQLAHRSLGPQRIAKAFGVKINKVKQPRPRASRAKAAKVAQ